MSKIAEITQEQRTNQRIDFDKSDYDRLVIQKGLNMVHEIAIKCSCIREINGNPLSECFNCGGAGFVFIDPCEIKGLIQAINFDPKFMQYSEYNLGTAMLTVQQFDAQRLGWNDRLTIAQGESIFSENIFPEIRDLGGGNEASALLTYDALDNEIDHAYLFVNPRVAHTPLEQFEADGVTPKDFEVNGRIVKLSDALRDALIASGERKYFIGVRYRHRPQYMVMDLQKDIRNTNVIASGGLEELKKLPIHCIIKRVHYMLGDKGFDE